MSEPDKPQILIVCDNDSETQQLEDVFQKAEWASKAVKTVASGCEWAKSGQFQVVLCAARPDDGSWKDLIDVGSQSHVTFEVILLAHTFDLKQWAEALQIGAFEVVDTVSDLQGSTGAAKRALGASYLKRFRLSPVSV